MDEHDTCMDSSYMSQDIMDCFPKKYTPRDEQIDVLKRFEEMSKSYDDIIISVPVGVGKTHIAYAIAKYLKPAFIVTPTKQLQNQYSQTLGAYLIKGKNNFVCAHLFENANPEKRKLTMISEFKKARLTCDYGVCVYEDINGTVTPCKYKSSDGINQQCLYYNQKSTGLKSSVTVLNYPLYLLFRTFRMDDTFRDAVIFDEAHTLENNLTMFSGITIKKEQLNEVGLIFYSFDTKSIDGIHTLVTTLANKYHQIINKLKIDPNSYPLLNQTKLKGKMAKLERLALDIDQNPENFVFSYDDYNQSLTVKPIDLTRITQHCLDSKKRVFLSGTMAPKHFTDTIGIDPSKCGVIEVKKSPFPAQNRQVKFLDVAPMSYSSSNKQRLLLIDTIDKILLKNQGKRGIILSSSKQRCSYILENLDEASRRRVKVAHSDNSNGLTIDAILKRHSEESDSVLLSSSLWEGVDLSGKLSEFQILEKCPYPPMDDLRTKRKMLLYPKWYTYITLIKILQGLGRSVRTMQDNATTYCLDTKIHSIIRQNGQMIPQSYHDVLFAGEYHNGF